MAVCIGYINPAGKGELDITEEKVAEYAEMRERVAAQLPVEAGGRLTVRIIDYLISLDDGKAGRLGGLFTKPDRIESVFSAQ